MRYGLALSASTNLAKTIDIARKTLESRIETLWVLDFPSTRDAFVVASTLAYHFEKRIGIGLLSPFIIRPTQIVQGIKSLVSCFGDRFELLLGVGDINRLMDVGIDIEQKHIFRRFRGLLEDTQKQLKDNDIYCPLILGAQGPNMIRLSASTDGVLLNYADPDMIEWAIEQIDKRDNQNIGVFPASQLDLQDTGMLPTDLRYAAAIIGIGATERVLERFGIVNELKTARDLFRKEGLSRSVLDMIDEKILQRFCLLIDYNNLDDYVNTLKDKGVSQIVFGPPVSTSGKTTERLSNLIGKL